MKTCFLFPRMVVTVKVKKVYPAHRLPYPGDPSCDCEPCQETWMKGLAEALRRQA